MWDVKPSKFAAVVEKDTVKHAKNIATDLLNGLTALAPVDTTRYVSNMNVSMNNADFTFVEDKYIGWGGALADGLQKIARMPDNKLHDIHISNATPYGDDLEDGWSLQAPKGVFFPTFLAVAQYYK